MECSAPSLTVGLLTQELYKKDEDRCASQSRNGLEGRRFGRRAGGCQEDICKLSFGPERYLLSDDCWGSGPATH